MSEIDNINIVALITVYHPKENVISHIESILKQVESVVIIDNGGGSKLNIHFLGNKKVAFLNYNSNLGLSIGFNKALCQEVVCKSDFLIFFDQDSNPDQNLIEQLIIDFKKIEKLKKIGCIGPSIYDVNRSDKLEFSGKLNFITKNIEKVGELITSGLLTKYSILKEIGFWDETIFLDFADYELCWRLESKGYICAVSQNAILNHSLGEGIFNINFLGRKLQLSYSKPFREYYQTRDALKLVVRKYVPLRWKKNFIFNLTFRIVYFEFKLPEKLKRLSYFIKGFKDGLRKRSGEYISRK